MNRSKNQKRKALKENWVSFLKKNNYKFTVLQKYGILMLVGTVVTPWERGNAMGMFDTLIQLGLLILMILEFLYEIRKDKKW